MRYVGLFYCGDLFSGLYPDQIIENNVDAPSTQSIDCETDDAIFNRPR